MSSAATGLSELRRQFSQPLFILLGVTGIVLLIACANVGNLVLARAATRRPEFALRLALGAGRSRLMRQVLVEGFVLAGLAGLAGIALAIWATRALVTYASVGQGAVVLDLSPDLRVLAFTAIVSMLAALLFGSVPAIRASRLDASLDGRRDSRPGRAMRAVRAGALVIVQVALSLVLLVGAGLFVRTLQNLTPPRVRHRPVASAHDRARRAARQRRSPQARRAERFDLMYRELIAKIESIPGVQSASLARSSPLAPSGYGFRFTMASGGEPRMVPALIVYPRYFATMGIPS